MNKYITILACLIFFAKAHSQTQQSAIPTTDDRVNSIVRYNNTIYVGGEFALVGTTPRNYLAAIDANTSAVLPWNPAPDNKIDKMIIAGTRLVIIGSFNTISGSARNRICVYDLPSGTLLNSNIGGWYSNPQGLHYLGNFVYFCDNDSMGGAAVRRFDINTLQEDASWQSTYFGFDDIYSLTSLGNYIYAGGWLDIFNGSIYIDNICRFNLSNGNLDTSFHLAFNNGDYVREVVGHNGKIYATGNYTQIGGLSRNGIAEIDPAGFVTTKNIYCSNHYNVALTLQGNTLWIGGNSVAIGGINRYCIAQVDISTGIATCWFTQAMSGNVYLTSIFAQHDTVYAASNNIGFKAFTGNPGYVSIGNDTVICAGGSIVMNAPLGLQNYLWNTGATTSSITVTTPGNYWFSSTGSGGCIVGGSRIISACTGIPNNASQIPLQVTPTISDGIYLLRFPLQKTAGKIEVTDLKGKSVYYSFISPVETSRQLDISLLAPGMYFCRIAWRTTNSSVIKLVKE